MFRALLSAALVLIGGAFLSIAMGELSVLADVHGTELQNQYGDNSRWTSLIVTWFPLIAAAVAAAVIVVSAVNQRAAGRGRL